MSRLSNGWFVVPRSLIEHYMTDGIDLALMVWLIGRANFIDSNCAIRAGHRRVLLARGQLVTSVSEIQKCLKVPSNKIRMRLKRFSDDNKITIKTTNTGTIITINDYEEMQDFNSYKEQTKPQSNHNQTTIEPQPNHNILTKETNETKETKELFTESQNDHENIKPKKKAKEKTAKEPKPKKESSGAYEVIARYCELFEQKYQAKAKISGIDAGCLSRIAKSNGMEQGIKIVETYFAMNDSWISQQCYPASLIEKNLNKILVYLKRTENSAHFDYGIKPLTSGEE